MPTTTPSVLRIQNYPCSLGSGGKGGRQSSTARSFLVPAAGHPQLLRNVLRTWTKIAAGTAEVSKFLGHPPSGTLIQQRHFVHVLGGLVAPVKQLAPLFLADIFCQVGLALLLGSRADEPKLGKETGKCI